MKKQEKTLGKKFYIILLSATVVAIALVVTLSLVFGLGLYKDNNDIGNIIDDVIDKPNNDDDNNNDDDKKPDPPIEDDEKPSDPTTKITESMAQAD